MRLIDHLERAVLVTAEMKKQHFGTAASFPPLIIASRGNDPIAMIRMRGLTGLKDILGLMSIAVVGFASNVMTVSFESCSTPLRTHPLTGKPWSLGELPTLLGHPDALKKGWIEFELQVCALNLAGDYAYTRTPFTAHTGEVVYGERETYTSAEGDDPELALAPIQSMQSVMMQRHTVVPKELLTMDVTQRDVATLSFIQKTFRASVTLSTSASDKDRLQTLLEHGGEMLE